MARDRDEGPLQPRRHVLHEARFANASRPLEKDWCGWVKQAVKVATSVPMARQYGTASGTVGGM